jgi:hypothetical protein
VDVWVWKAGYSYQGKTSTVGISLFFDKIKSEIDLPDQDGELYNVKPQLQITGIAYVGHDHWGYRRLQAKPWLGFTEYSGKIVSPYP